MSRLGIWLGTAVSSFGLVAPAFAATLDMLGDQDFTDGQQISPYQYTDSSGELVTVTSTDVFENADANDPTGFNKVSGADPAWRAGWNTGASDDDKFGYCLDPISGTYEWLSKTACDDADRSMYDDDAYKRTYVEGTRGEIAFDHDVSGLDLDQYDDFQIMLGIFDHDSYLDQSLRILFNDVEQDVSSLLGISQAYSSYHVVTLDVSRSLLDATGGFLSVEIFAIGDAPCPAMYPTSCYGNSLGVDFSKLSATAVPLPAPALLLLGGIAGLAAMRRRR